MKWALQEKMKGKLMGILLSSQIFLFILVENYEYKSATYEESAAQEASCREA
jgi:hypothetical protein